MRTHITVGTRVEILPLPRGTRPTSEEDYRHEKEAGRAGHVVSVIDYLGKCRVVLDGHERGREPPDELSSWSYYKLDLVRPIDIVTQLARLA